MRRTDLRPAGNWRYVGQFLRTSLPLAACDVAALIAAICGSTLLGLDWRLGDAEQLNIVARWFTPTVAGLLTINGALGLYPGVRLGLVEEFRLLSVSLTVLLITTVARMSFGSELFVDRITFTAVTFAAALFLTPLFRSRLRRWLARRDWWGFPTLVCGDDSAVVSVYQWLVENRRLGLRPLGIIAGTGRGDLDGDAPGYLGSWTDAHELALKRGVYWTVMVEPSESNVEMTSLVEQHLSSVPHVLVVSELTGMPDHWNRHQTDEGLEGLMVEQHLLLPFHRIVKRAMDLAIVLAAAVALAPLLLACAILVKLTSRGPIFYGHERVGLGNTRFKAWKFRTMVLNAEHAIEDYLLVRPELREEWETTHKLKDDPRVTPLGRFMRKWSIDELPQLWNVLVGEMSAVGPRPIVPNEIPTYGEHFDIFCTVLPGITGLWQVSGRNDTSFAERIMLGTYYIHHWSPWLDLYLLARTVKVVLFTKGAY